MASAARNALVMVLTQWPQVMSLTWKEIIRCVLGGWCIWH
jgi:hypothetical protein